MNKRLIQACGGVRRDKTLRVSEAVETLLAQHIKRIAVGDALVGAAG